MGTKSIGYADRYLREGDWVDVAHDFVTAAARAGRSQYELLTNLGSSFARSWSSRLRRFLFYGA
jgi:hypothetical protein